MKSLPLPFNILNRCMLCNIRIFTIEIIVGDLKSHIQNYPSVDLNVEFEEPLPFGQFWFSEEEQLLIEANEEITDWGIKNYLPCTDYPFHKFKGEIFLNDKSKVVYSFFYDLARRASWISEYDGAKLIEYPTSEINYV